MQAVSSFCRSKRAVRFSKFPYVSHPLFQFSNIGIAETPGAVDAATGMIDVRGNPADSN